MGRPREKGNLIVLRPRNDGGSYTVSQRDLEELLYLERQMRDAAELWRIKRDTIKKYLEFGCSIEPGLREARLDVLIEDATGERPKSSAKLVVR